MLLVVVLATVTLLALVASLAVPVKSAVIVPAAKLPSESLETTVFAVLRDVCCVTVKVLAPLPVIRAPAVKKFVPVPPRDTASCASEEKAPRPSLINT